MTESKHDKVAKKIAKQEGTTYNQGPGADIKSARKAVEVETPKTIGDAARQLQGYRKPVYVAPTDPKAVTKTIKHYKKTTIGVMTPTGKIVKPSTRSRKK